MTERSKRFEKFVNVVLKNEGGYVNDPKDPGGETNFGISKRTFPNEDIKHMTRDRAKDIYYKNYYLRVNGDSFTDPLLALSLFDFAVNAGVGRAIKMLQRLLGVTIDGILGEKTIEAANKKKNVGMLYQIERKSYYMSLPTFDRFGSGWINRVNGLNDEV